MCEGKRPPHRLAQTGMRWTKIYLICLFGGIPVFAFFGLIELHPLELNEVGDFLAGAFGPLALFWVVLGFFQQGEELQNSVDALNLQAKEMRASVEQQKAMLEVTRAGIEQEKQKLEDERIRIEEAAKPILSVSFKTAEKAYVVAGVFTSQIQLERLQFHNVGGPVSSLEVLLKTEERDVDHFSIGALGTGSTSGKDIKSGVLEGKSLFATLTYSLANGVREQQEFHASSLFHSGGDYPMTKIGETQRI